MGEQGRGRRKMTETITASSYHGTVINSLLVWDFGAPAMAVPDDEPPLPSTTAPAIYDHEIYRS